MRLFRPFRRGFSVVEVMIAALLIVFGFFTFFSVFSTGSHHATQTRNRAVANLMAQSIMEEFKAHNYGDPAPASWSEEEERPFRMVIGDREAVFKFHKSITFANGSFVGNSNDNQDLATIVITWKELRGADQTDGAPTGQPEDNKELSVQVPLWR